jgi:mRNA interferase MazF
VSTPLRGEIWLCDFDPVRGHEQGLQRPALVVSANTFNQGPADLVIVLPLTGKDRGIPLHVKVQPPEGGSKKASYVLCEQIRCVARERLTKRWGSVKPATIQTVERNLRVLLEL